MNGCHQFEEQVIAEAVGDLETQHRATLETHLANCGACRQRLVREQQLFASIDAGIVAMAAGEPSADFAAKVMAQVTGEAERKLLAAIDAGLAQTVAAEPSPAFAARVRQRIAAEPERQRTWFSWGWVTATGAVAAAALLAVVIWPGEPKLTVSNPIPSLPPKVHLGASRETPRDPGREPSRVVDPLRAESRIPPVAASAKLPQEPEVLIPDDERRVVTRFYRFVQEGRINPAQVLEANRIELAAKLGELQTPLLAVRSSEVKTMGLVDSVRSTSEDK